MAAPQMLKSKIHCSLAIKSYSLFPEKRQRGHRNADRRDSDGRPVADIIQSILDAHCRLLLELIERLLRRFEIERLGHFCELVALLSHLSNQTVDQLVLHGHKFC